MCVCVCVHNTQRIGYGDKSLKSSLPTLVGCDLTSLGLQNKIFHLFPLEVARASNIRVPGVW